MDWTRGVRAEQVIYYVTVVGHRKASIPSLAGFDPAVPRGTAPSSGIHEALLGMLAGRDGPPKRPGVSPLARKIFHDRYIGHAGYQDEHTPVYAPDLASVEAWERADPQTRGPLFTTSERRAVQLPDPVIARRLGVTMKELKRAVSEALAIVEENLAERRLADKEEGQCITRQSSEEQLRWYGSRLERSR